MDYNKCMLYNKFRLAAGRLFSVLLVFFVGGGRNYSGLVLILLGVFIRVWASGHINKNKELTMSGPYRYIRNPLYTGSFFIALGVIVFFRLWFIAILYAAIFFVIYLLKSKLEETVLLEIFGSKYAEYAKKTPAFIPRLGRNPLPKSSGGFKWSNVLYNKEHYNFIGLVLVFAALIYLGHLTSLANEKTFISVIGNIIEKYLPGCEYLKNLTKSIRQF